MPNFETASFKTLGIPDAAQTMTQRGATTPGFDKEQAMSRVMDVWNGYLDASNLTEPAKPVQSGAQMAASTYGEAPAEKPMAYDTRIVGRDPSAIPAAAPATAGNQQLWDPDTLSKYPELAKVTDAKFGEELMKLPDLAARDIGYGPGLQEYKGRTSAQQWNPLLQQILAQSGFLEKGTNRVMLPTTKEELDKWNFTRAYIASTKLGMGRDIGWELAATDPQFKNYTPWTQPGYMTDGKFDPVKYQAVANSDRQYHERWMAGQMQGYHPNTVVGQYVASQTPTVIPTAPTYDPGGN